MSISTTRGLLPRVHRDVTWGFLRGFQSDETAHGVSNESQAARDAEVRGQVLDILGERRLENSWSS